MSGKTISHAAATLIAAAMVSTAFALHPAAANNLHQIVESFGITACSASTPCIGGSNSGTGPGVKATGTSGTGLVASSATGAGIVSTSTKNNGIKGATNYNSFNKPSRFSGVAGYDDSTSGANDNGVLGSSTNGIGVRGISANGDGVVGSTNGGTNTAAVRGNDTSSVGEVGVIGYSTSGVGVNGLSISSYGVQGYSQNDDGISGASINSNGIGAFSTYGPGLFATSGSSIVIDAVSSTNNGEQTIQAIGGTSAAGGYSLATFNSSQSPTMVMDNGGSLHISNLIYTGGSCSSGCAKTEDGLSGRVERYAPEEVAPTMEDVGEAQLANGSVCPPRPCFRQRHRYARQLRGLRDAGGPQPRALHR